MHMGNTVIIDLHQTLYIFLGCYRDSMQARGDIKL